AVKTHCAQAAFESRQVGGALGLRDGAGLGAVGRIMDESLDRLDERRDESLGVGGELLALGEHLIAARGGVDLKTVFDRFAEEEFLGLPEEGLLDPAVLENIEGGVAEEAIAHPFGEMLQQLRVTRVGQVDEILALEALLRAEEGQVGALE